MSDKCTYPDCKCPFDMGADNKCSKGFPRTEKNNPYLNAAMRQFASNAIQDGTTNEIKVDGVDVGEHYRFQFKKKLTQTEITNGVAIVDLDFYRVADACGFKHPAQQHVIKKLWNPGNRGHNTLVEDIDDCIGALLRWKQMINESVD